MVISPVFLGVKAHAVGLFPEPWAMVTLALEAVMLLTELLLSGIVVTTTVGLGAPGKEIVDVKTVKPVADWFVLRFISGEILRVGRT